jgi:hypothetical protein
MDELQPTALKSAGRPESVYNFREFSSQQESVRKFLTLTIMFPDLEDVYIQKVLDPYASELTREDLHSAKQGMNILVLLGRCLY